MILCHVYSRQFFFGWAGVDVFFVLSGFLITGIILRQREQPGFLRNFYARRTLRIWPLYYAVIGGTLALNAWLGSYDVPAAHVGQYLTFTQHVQDCWGAPWAGWQPCLGHTWTLAIEEQFYLLWPALLLLLPRRGVVIAACVLGTGSILWRASGQPSSVLPGHADGFAWGAILASVPAWTRGRRAALWILLLAVPLAVLLCCRDGWGGSLRTLRFHKTDARSLLAINLWAAALVGLLAAHRGSRWLSPLRWPWLVFLGRVSFGLYLLQEAVFVGVDVLAAQAHGPLWMWNAAKVGGCVVVAALSWWAFEEPILRLKSYFSYERKHILPLRA